MAIEVEVRSFISKDKYEELIEFFKENGKLVKKDHQVTFYFDSEKDLRIQKNKKGSKIWLKKGELHDSSREELEIYCQREDFEKLEEFFETLGYEVETKWFRDRYHFFWKDVDAMVDYTKGYGHILELEKEIEAEDQEKEVLEKLKKRMEELGIEPDPKEKFDQKYQYYKENWKDSVGD